MTPKQTPPKIDANSPLQKGHRWIYVPVLFGTFLNVVFTIVWSYVGP